MVREEGREDSTRWTFSLGRIVSPSSSFNMLFELLLPIRIVSSESMDMSSKSSIVLLLLNIDEANICRKSLALASSMRIDDERLVIGFGSNSGSCSCISSSWPIPPQSSLQSLGSQLSHWYFCLLHVIFFSNAIFHPLLYVRVASVIVMQYYWLTPFAYRYIITIIPVLSK